MTKSESRGPKSEGNPKSEIRILAALSNFAFRNADFREAAAVRHYMLFSLSALFVIVVCLAGRRLEWWCLGPAAIGCLTLLTRWKHGPPLVLLSLAVLLGLSGRFPRWGLGGWSRSPTPALMDVILCIAVLAYVVGHYRLVALTRSIFPPAPRRSKGGEWPVASGESKRPSFLAPRPSPLATRKANRVTVWEMVFLWLTLLLWGIPRDLWLMLRLVWVCLAVLAAAGIVTGYLRRATATSEESLLYLQDQCWRQTRRAQSSLNRWLTWARLRAQRKKESS
jgi:hypothetical protein